ncbi:MAG: uroporphyrinogen-III C-methyltransferase [Phycisphaerales bacterium]|nr:uroporphyrinogen-III C-methyltransferase [Phycisphaerales bacterium]
MKSQSNPGTVHLVGAGPGDPSLLTLRGAQLLAVAEVVVYDALVNPALLEHCPRAKLFYVGKKAASHSLTQDQINALLIEQAKAGHRVVRLKGGDPFVFGRGGEECEALGAAGVPFEVVPGITAAIAVPAYAGIPVTHRDFNSSFTFITGHEKEDEYRDPQTRDRDPAAGSSDVDWGTLAKLPCLAFYMGVKSLPRICEKLIEHGMDRQTPAATIRRGTLPQQQTVIGTLADLPRQVAEAKLTPPALTIIGKVVSLRQTMNWFESRPLFGQTILITRTRRQASELNRRLDELGAAVLEAPTIELHRPENWAEVDQALLRAGEFDWIVFTSVNGVEFARRRLRELGRDVRQFGTAKLAAIGDATAAAIERELSLKVDRRPRSFVAEALADELLTGGQVAGNRFLLLRADIARPILREKLLAGRAAEVLDVPIYQTRLAAALPPEVIQTLDAGQVHWITFTSSSTARNFCHLLGDDCRRRLNGIRIASIGPVTTATLKELGIEPTVEARTFNLDGLVDAMVAATRK